MAEGKKDLRAQIEAILFVYGEPISLRQVASLTKANEKQVSEALEGLKETLRDDHRGLDLVIGKDEVQLVTAPELSDLVSKLVKEELDTKLTPAALETLTIVAYLGPCSRAVIEYIRGVNCAFMLRNLMVRGLVERRSDPQKTGGYIYQVTFDFLKHMGVTSAKELPEYERYTSLAQTLINGDEEGQ
ncbi:MAG: SMC-Scp complex subunit ScpB [Patescibacteria group bacterium]|nr:SMC-Scp complex subunit ScpB [Patescibacteria group bacterium]